MSDAPSTIKVATRALGSSGLDVSAVGLGCNNFGRRADLKGTRAVVDAALSVGVTFFDTADTYGNGRGETIMAQAFPGADRDEIVIATKFGYDWESALGKRREGHEGQHADEPGMHPAHAGRHSPGLRKPSMTSSAWKTAAAESMSRTV